MSNLEDIKRNISGAIRVEKTYFTRKEFIQFMDKTYQNWVDYCKENDIEIVEPVQNEIIKFIDLIKVENVITDKMINTKLAFGRDAVLADLAERWKLEYNRILREK